MNAYELFDYLKFKREIFGKIEVNIFDNTGTEFYITEHHDDVFKIEVLSDYLSEAFFMTPKYNNLSHFPGIEFPVRFPNETG